MDYNNERIKLHEMKAADGAVEAQKLVCELNAHYFIPILVDLQCNNEYDVLIANLYEIERNSSFFPPVMNINVKVVKHSDIKVEEKWARAPPVEHFSREHFVEYFPQQFYDLRYQDRVPDPCNLGLNDTDIIQQRFKDYKVLRRPDKEDSH
uniref:Uncharacterized protein n=1 Tax=Parascaris equorum TaxID=6256 RepID=A0A914S6K7_PAREQ